MMSISTTDGLAVVHLFPDPDSCFLLDGDRVVDEQEFRKFHILDLDVTFSGAFICTADRAQAVVDAFTRGDDPGELGRWTRL
ncbi:hypothetical protein Back2_20260 [Nocardioides baekrokdamisoli]|uniref:Uncharacterized protein n=1 Tax=Nocardioides baekrokdamisoli TaxID=1804624 RepID=A0A3G9J3Z6_9ACTN|nr:hypothetical protein [Nocardioides baekrokdamisoli]BBH17739.1 hypothetical protein Back2_20260 [Nocardioides baekrokdamisoli]